MKIMVITSSPNVNGLTAACSLEAIDGAKSIGAEVLLVRLNDMNIGACHACGNGWGTCLNEHNCQVEDDFEKLHKSIKDIDGFIIVTPVYWGEMSESAKAFFDRLRRCEAHKKDKNFIEGKPVICVAAAGGTGNGCINCLSSMERLVDHMRGIKYDFIGVTRRNRQYKLKAIRSAVESLTVSLE